MKKFLLILVILSGCATQQTYTAPDYITARPTERINECLHACMSLDYETNHLFIAKSNDPNAWVDGDNKMYITEGMFQYDDKCLAFIIAHELSHIKLHHHTKTLTVSYVTTGIMMIANALIPGVGYLNHVINPAIVNNFSKAEEYDADKLAWKTCQKCFKFTEADLVHIFNSLKPVAGGGGFWSTHPAWDDRLTNIQNSQNLNE
jgi:Zn-dependent protease with chaperone function